MPQRDHNTEERLSEAKVFRYRVALQGRGNENAVIQAIAAGASLGTFTHLKGAYAYASSGGASDLVEALKSELGNWDEVEKQWLISIDFGHTDPRALGLLAALPNSRVRVPYAAEVLARNRLLPIRAFHSKTLILFGSGTGAPPLMVALGSANMTISGLRTGHEDVSVANWTVGRLGVGERAQLDTANKEIAWFDRAWRTSTNVTTSLVDAYRSKRPSRSTPEDSSGRVRELEQNRLMPFDQVAALQSSTRLWVEVKNVNPNLGHGRPGNQIHFRRGARVFFGLSPRKVPKKTLLGTIDVIYMGREFPRHMRYSHNGMDTLDLPVPGTEGPTAYDHTVLVFDQVGPSTFNLRTATASQVASLKTQSADAGTLYTLGGGRQWGVVA